MMISFRSLRTDPENKSRYTTADRERTTIGCTYGETKMEALLLIVFIVVCLVIVAISGRQSGYIKGVKDATDRLVERDSHYRPTSQPTGQSGTRTQERGSDDTG